MFRRLEWTAGYHVDYTRFVLIIPPRGQLIKLYCYRQEGHRAHKTHAHSPSAHQISSCDTNSPITPSSFTIQRALHEGIPVISTTILSQFQQLPRHPSPFQFWFPDNQYKNPNHVPTTRQIKTPIPISSHHPSDQTPLPHPTAYNHPTLSLSLLNSNTPETEKLPFPGTWIVPREWKKPTKTKNEQVDHRHLSVTTFCRAQPKRFWHLYYLRQPILTRHVSSPP